MAARALRERNYDADLDRRELEHLGVVGLLESIESYTPRAGSDFAGYASKRVYGAIVDGIHRSSDLRAQLSAARDSRAERIRSIDSGSQRDRLSRLVDVAIGLAIGLMLEDTGMFIDDTVEPVREYTSNDLEILSDQFNRVVAELPGKQGDVIRHHYYHDIPFTEIATLLGVSKARISQLHAEGLKAIRDRLSRLGLVDDFY
jgi:RNA polymerase sigma factor for flagellar operon FliA